jgi:uncharacterized membrane protein YgdD (TMEM256/DUF423 family)
MSAIPPVSGRPPAPAAPPSSGALFVRLGALSGFVGVAAGAFGAHALRGRLDPDMVQVFETGVRYQILHALALMGIGLGVNRLTPRPAWAAGWLFVIGTVIFSGSLYALALSGVRVLGALTPFGGLALLTGWLALAVAAGNRRGP